MATQPRSIRTHRPAGDPVPDGENWRHRAACRHAEPAIFFPLPGQSTGPALRYCRDCPVRTECLEDAIAGGHGGVRGGMAEDARRQLRRSRRCQETS